jgi:hypothetical protein
VITRPGRQKSGCLKQRKFAVKDRFMPDLASLLPVLLIYFERNDYICCMVRSLTVTNSNILASFRAILLLVICLTSAYEQSDLRVMSNCLSWHPLLNRLTLNFNTQIEMLGMDDVGVVAHLGFTACEQATDSAVIWSQQLDQPARGKTLVNCCIARSVSANHCAVSRMHLLP